MRARLRDRLPLVVAEDASKPSVSWLKFETEAQILAKRFAKRSYWRPLLQPQKSVVFYFLNK